MNAAVIAVVAIIAFDGLIVWALVRSIGKTWRRYAERWPPQAMAADGVTKRFQSFRFGIINAGWSMHVTVDERHLHLVPTRIMRWVGCSDLSIPWDDIAVRSKFLGRWCTVRLADGTHMTGPSWCFELVAPAHSDEHATRS